MPKQNLTDDEFIEKMTAGESPVEPSPTRSEQALRAYMEAANPRVSVRQQPLDPGVVGAVRSSNPDEVLLSSKMKQGPGKTEEVLLHEMEHSLSLRGGNPLGAASKFTSGPITTDNNYRFDLLYNMGDKKIENPSVKDIRRISEAGEGEKKRLTMIQNFVNNRRSLEQFFGRPIDSAYFNPNMLKAQVRFGTEGALFAEQIADLSALEQLTGKSLTRDKEMKKLLFPDDRSAQIYDAITGYRQTRLDSKDLPPYTPVSPEEPGMLDRLKSLFGMQEGGEVSNDEFIQQMTVGTLPADAQEGTAEEAFRALVEGGQGFFGLEPGRKGTEAYRTGQALSNLPMLAIPAAAVKAAPKVKGAVEDVATRAVRRIAENPDLSARDIYNAMLGKQAPGVPITTYHGSGNLFQQLDPSKAKSGVGEQRYGMGAGYTAESRPVAESFIGAEAQALRASGGMDPKLEFVYDLVSQKRSDKDVLDMVAARYGNAVSFDEAADILQKAKSMTKGYLYKGDIPDEILPSFLDWNKSLKQQTPEVKKLLGKDPLVKESSDPKRWNEVSGGIIQKGEGGLDDLTGDSIYKYISLKLGSDSAATEYLDKLGVRGIRYADPGSKGLGRAPSGTSNFVVFRPEDYRIESVNDMPVGKTISSPKAVRQVFEQAEKLPTNQFIDEVMSAHIGGVGDFGDESAKYYLSQIPGGPAYIKASQELAKKNLGNQFMAYRLMPKDQFEALQSGDVGDLLSFSLSQSSAEALKKFVKNQKRDDLVVAEVPLTPEHVIAFGSPSEQEVIIDTGVGWSLDQFKQAAPLKKAEGGEVSNEDFIEQMTVGTRPTDQEADPNVVKDIVRGVQYTPFDVLGAPVDIATMVMRPFGYNVEKPFGGSDYFIEQAAKRGLVQPSTGSGAELLGRIAGGAATPAVARGVGKVAEKTEDFVSKQLGAAAEKVEERSLAKLREQTGNPNLSAKQVYDAMFAAQAPGAAIIKPKGGNVIMENIDIVNGFPVHSSPINKMRPMVTVPGEKDLPPSRIYASEFAARLKEQIERNKQAGYPTAYMENQLSDVEPKAALDNWIQTKLGKYIRTDMGSEADPVRKLAEEMSTKVRADYEAGLKRIGKMKDNIAKAKAAGKNTDASEAELAEEIDKVENAYRQTSMLPVSIGPYTHPSSINVKNRAMAGLPEEPISKTGLGKEWEEVADREFYLHRAGDLVEADSPAFRANPWLANINPNEIVYTAPYVDEMHMFTHTLDELENALNPASGLPQKLQLKPEDMQQLGIEKAFRLVNDINDWRFQQRTALNLEEAKRAAVTVKQYPNTPGNLQWQQLKAPTYTELPPGYAIEQLDYDTAVLKGPDGKALTYFGDIASGNLDVQKEALSFLSRNDLERALKYEGATMRHCVGGYCDPVYSGDTQIFSLRDNKGEPHVTIEVYPPRVEQTDANTMLEFLQTNPGNVIQRLGFDADDFSYAYRTKSGFNPAALKEFGGFVKNIMAAPEYKEWLSTLNRPAKIEQIKGKGNQKPSKKYISFVQDFVRSGQWSEVKDLQNAELTKVGDKYLSAEEIAPLVQRARTFIEEGPALQPYREAQRALDDYRGPIPSAEYTELYRKAGQPVHPDIQYTYNELKAILDDPEAFSDTRSGDALGPHLARIENLRQLLGDQNYAAGGEVTKFIRAHA